jgi:hypothetical protein
MNNDPITSLPADQIAQFPTLPATSEAPTATTSGDESMLDKIKEYLLNENTQQPKKVDPTQNIDSKQQYGFIGGQKKGKSKKLQNPEYISVHDEEGVPPTVRFEQYVPNKRIAKTGVRTKRLVFVFD